MMLRALLVILLLVHGELRAAPLPKNPDFAPSLTIYLAKGPPNSCGPGCDRWIAVEGKVDQNAASRIRRFLQNVKDTQRPIYFHSPGGDVDQGYIIGRLLRSRKAVARVGRIIVSACNAGTQIDDACLKIKTGGGEVEAEIATRGAMCNSACGYIFLGATSREVAPDAAMVVHNSKLSLVFRGHPSAQQIALFTDRSRSNADRNRRLFIKAMSIGHELDDLIGTVKFENSHVLTRSELYRFGIDTRIIAETAWTLETAGRLHIRKDAVAKKGDDESFRAMEWRLFCEKADRSPLMFVREYDQGTSGMNSVVMMAGSVRSVAFDALPERMGAYEAWNGAVTSNVMKAVLAESHLQMRESTMMPDGKTNQEVFDIDTSGLKPAWTKLVASCPAAPSAAGNPRPAIAPPSTSSTPAQ